MLADPNVSSVISIEPDIIEPYNQMFHYGNPKYLAVPRTSDDAMGLYLLFVGGTAPGEAEQWLNMNKNDAILRVIDLGAAEGDKRFYKIRMKILNAVTNSLTDSIKDLQSKGKVDKEVSPAAVAGSLVVMLAGAASHQKGFTSWGVKQAELKPNLALLVHLGVTGKKPAR